MSTTTKPAPAEETTRISPEEYQRREERADHKSEYRDGNIVPMPGASPKHVQINKNLFLALHGALRGTSCAAYTSDMRVHIDAYSRYTYPDLVVVCGEKKYVPDQPHANLLNPTLVVEVFSDSTEGYDRGEKFALYRTLASFQEYVLVAQDKRHVEVFAKNEDDQWVLREFKADAETVELASVDATLDTAAIYEDVDFEGNVPANRGADASQASEEQ